MASTVPARGQEAWSCNELPPAYRQRLLSGQPRFNTYTSPFGVQTVCLHESWLCTSQQRSVDAIGRIADAGYTWVFDYVRGGVDPACDADIAAGLGWQTAACLASAAGQRARVSDQRWRWWLDAIAARGLEPVVRVDFAFFGGSMPLANTAGWELRRQAYARLYADFAAALVAAFPEIHAWQIGNEPDLWGGLNTVISGSQYVDMVSVVAPAMRAANRRVEIWGGVVSDLGDFYQQTYAPCGNMPDKARGIGTAMLDSGINNWIDVFAVHDYNNAVAEGSSRGCAITSTPTDGATQKQYVNSRLDTYGLPAMAITEQGYALSWKAGTEAEKLAEQARHAVKRMVLAMTAGVRRHSMYTFLLQSGNRAGSQEETFGIADTLTPWSPRPAYDAVQRTNRVLDDSMLYRPEYATVNHSAVQLHSFRRLGTTFETQHWLWSTDGVAHTVTLRIVGTEPVAPVAFDLLSGTLTPLTYSYVDGCLVVGALQIDSNPVVVIVPNRSAVQLVAAWFGWS